jgi:hypothetical protein
MYWVEKMLQKKTIFLYRMEITSSDLWFSSGIPVYYTKKTDHNDINKILLKVTFKHHDLTRPQSIENMSWDIYNHHHYLFMA